MTPTPLCALPAELVETSTDQRTVRRIGKGVEAGSYVSSAANVTQFATYGNTFAVAKKTTAYVQGLSGKAGSKLAQEKE